MKPLLARSHNHSQLLQSPPANKKQNRAASPTPAATTVEKATRSARDELGDRAHQMYFASESQHAQYYAKTQPPPPTEKSKKVVAGWLGGAITGTVSRRPSGASRSSTGRPVATGPR